MVLGSGIKFTNCTTLKLIITINNTIDTFTHNHTIIILITITIIITVVNTIIITIMIIVQVLARTDLETQAA